MHGRDGAGVAPEVAWPRREVVAVALDPRDSGAARVEQLRDAGRGPGWDRDGDRI